MRRSTLSLLPLVLLAGCGGGSHHSASTDDFGTGVSGLNKALTGTSGRSNNLKSSQGAFDRAYAKTPTDPRVALGYGVTTAALAADALGGLLGTDVLALVARKGHATHARSAVVSTAAHRLSLLAGLGVRLRAKGRTSLAATVPALAMGVRPKVDGATLLALVVQLRTAVSRLTDDEINALETNPLVLADPDDSTLSIKLGTVEGFALRSALNAVVGLVDGSVAYDLVPPTGYDPSAIFTTRFATQVAAGTAISPATYLPASPFGTYQSANASYLADLSTRWNGTADDGNLALTALGNRTGGGWLTDLIPLSDDDKTAIKAQLDELKAALQGPTAVPFTAPDGTTVNLTVNLAAVLANPPADLRAFFPSIQATDVSTDDGTATLQPVAGTVADPTLGGLVPGGVPDAILYGRTLDIDETTTLGAVDFWAALPFDTDPELSGV